MAKNLLIYTCLLIVVDLFFNVVINLIQGNPSEMIMISIVVRIIYLTVLFSLIGLIVLSLLRQQPHLLCLGVITVIVYLLVPIIIYFLKENDKGLWQVYLDLHIKQELFVAICLPYLLAGCVSLLIISWRCNKWFERIAQ
ncbi:hypothetical protein C5749_05750 [Sphingobacterium gobiense]|uniref:Uncharacterized protein n=1 Tax=Sphingobacterium gobiense TaxID=1382456 RepID=A0A2S9JU03_9SPHI|nr:hypothetical protein C5749_05750 [Sphingobacterium gobiense]